MKRYLIGGIIGYLVTSIFSISAPPVWFWWMLGSLCITGLIVYLLVLRMNNDDYGDLDE